MNFPKNVDFKRKLINFMVTHIRAGEQQPHTYTVYISLTHTHFQNTYRWTAGVTTFAAIAGGMRYGCCSCLRRCLRRH